MGTTKRNFFLRIPVSHQLHAAPHPKGKKKDGNKIFRVSLNIDDTWKEGELVIEVWELLERFLID
jgi:hypothetical protein